MPTEAYFNFTRLCSNLFYIMRLVFREGGVRGREGADWVGCLAMFCFNALRCLVLLSALLTT